MGWHLDEAAMSWLPLGRLLGAVLAAACLGAEAETGGALQLQESWGQLQLRGGAAANHGKKRLDVDVYFMVELLDKFRKFAIKQQAVSDHNHLVETEKLEHDIYDARSETDKQLLEGAATRNEESRIEASNAFNEMVNFVNTLKQAMGAKGPNPTCKDLTCGEHAYCDETVVGDAHCLCKDGYDGDGFSCKPPIQFTAHLLFKQKDPAPSVTDMNIAVARGNIIAVVMRDMTKGDKGTFMLGRVGVSEVFWNPPRAFSNQSKAYSPVVTILPNHRVAIAYRNQNEGGSGLVIAGNLNATSGKIDFGKPKLFAKHQDHAMQILPLPNSRAVIFFAEKKAMKSGEKTTFESFGAAQLLQVKADGSSDLLGVQRFSEQACTRLSAVKIGPASFVLAYRAEEDPNSNKKMEAAIIWGQHRDGELVFDPHPLSLEPEATGIWARSVALVAKDTVSYSYFSSTDEKTKQAILKVDPFSHKFTIVDGPKVLEKGFQTPFVGGVSFPYAPREAHTFTFFKKPGRGYAQAKMCAVDSGGHMKLCEEMSWAGYELGSVSGVPLGEGRLLFAFTDKQGTPYYQFVGLFGENEEGAEDDETHTPPPLAEGALIRPTKAPPIEEEATVTESPVAAAGET